MKTFRKILATNLIGVGLLATTMTATAQTDEVTYFLQPTLNYQDIFTTSSRYNDVWYAVSNEGDTLINSSGETIFNRGGYNFDSGIYVSGEGTDYSTYMYEEKGTLTVAPDFGLGGPGWTSGYVYDLSSGKIGYADDIYQMNSDSDVLNIMWYDGYEETELPENTAVETYVIESLVFDKIDDGWSENSELYNGTNLGIGIYANGEMLTGDTYYEDVNILYQEATNMENLLIAIEDENEKWALAEVDGTMISEYEFDNITEFKTINNVAAVQKDGMWGFINNPKTSEPITPPSTNSVFTDIPSGAIYLESVEWAVANKITTGTSETTFSPDNTLTRAEVVTFLWRANGSPEPISSVNPFSDVKEGDWFYKPVLWAIENNITSGTTSTTFSPTDTCSNAQVLTFLWRSNGSPEQEVFSNSGFFIDDSTPKVENYYDQAFLWASRESIIGFSYSPIPENPTPRKDIVRFLHKNDQI